MEEQYIIGTMTMKSGHWYAPRYAGRVVSLYRVKHKTGNEIIMELWEYDKKRRQLHLIDKYVPMDPNFFKSTAESESLVMVNAEYKEEHTLPDLPT
jgi:hypothetical protein